MEVVAPPGVMVTFGGLPLTSSQVCRVRAVATLVWYAHVTKAFVMSVSLRRFTLWAADELLNVTEPVWTVLKMAA